MSAIILPERCDRAATRALLPELVAAIGQQPIAIDASRVTEPGQAMLQMLVSARRTGGGAVITASQALRDMALMTGLSEELFDEDRP